MNDYNKNSFYTTNEEMTGKKKFYIRVNKEWVEVSKEVYYVCFNSYRKELRDITRNNKHRVISLDSRNDADVALIDTIGTEENQVERIIRKTQVEELLAIIGSLNNDEKELIIDLLLNEKKEKDLAKQYKVARQTINKRKQKIIKKIKKLMESGG